MNKGEDILSSPVEFLKGVGPEKAALLQKELSIFTFQDLLFHFPFRYVDKTSIQRISDLKENMPFCQVVGRVEKVELIGEGSARRFTAILNDGSGKLQLVWFKGLKWIQQVVVPGAEYLIFGKPSVFNGKLNIVHPELEKFTASIKPDEKIKLEPVYSTTEKLKTRGLDSKGIAKLMEALLTRVAPSINENLPDDILRQFRLISRRDALKYIHFPLTIEQEEHARRRLKFEELFFIQLKLLGQRNKRRQEIKGLVLDRVGDFMNTFYKDFLPFDLTGAQKRVIREIREDMRSGKQMNRLLQGDVGSGKTVVALMSMLLALDNEMQACIMAPTEILATQHFQSISKLLSGMPVKVSLLTGSTSKAERKRILEELLSGDLHMLVGTHALLEDWVKFRNLGLAIIDEQHRFGVAQRAALWKKNTTPPHFLVMSATPIPRTLAMTLYGDLDTSVIDEMPPGRKEIQTIHFFEKDRLRVFGLMRKAISQQRQVYVVYPLIEESETLDYNNLMEGYVAITREFPMPDFQVSIVHGRMNSADKEFEMQRFKRGETNILVSTTVIEVGVDVPNATVMVIESSEKFGLSQLHQLRGRVGRGGNQSYCFLLTGYKLSKDARLRMETMTRTSNGFEIAEADLQLRGPGDMAGTQQSGVMELKIANLAMDQSILTAARNAAMEIIDKDPHLVLPENLPLLNFLRSHQKGQPNWSLIS
jgi:ATP-dependent DNA helicase RecG